MAVLSVAVAIIAAELITRLLNAEAIASSMLCAVIFAAWLGGFGPALWAFALALLAFHYYLVPPINSFTWKHEFFVVSLSEVPRLFLFSITSLVVAFVISAQRKATEDLRRSGDDLQKAFDEIKKSEDRLRLVIDTIPTLVWRAGPDGVPDFLNQPALDYTGLSLDQAETGWPRAFHPDDKKGMLQKWSAIRESGMRGGLEARLRRFDGEYRWFLFQAEPLRDEAGNIVKWYGSSTDIEDRKRTEVALRESQQRFRDYAETASDWFWETGPDHRFIRVSEQLATNGISPALRIGAARWDFATDLEEEPDKWRRHVATLEAHEPFHNFRYRTTRGDGSVLHIAISGRPVFDPEGRFLGYRGVTSDVTAEVRAQHAEKALQQAQAELAREARLMTGDAVAAAMAHEIKQPLSAMVTGAEAAVRWLDRSMPDINEAKAALKRIAADGHRAGAVIESIRAMFKSDARNRTSLDINELINEAINMLRSDLQKHRISVQTDTNRRVRQVTGDRIQLQQVLLNLIANAIDSMAGEDEPRILSVKSEVLDSGIMVAVADSGKGIASQDVGRIFNPLFTTKTHGMGMGLSICRSIIEAHEGQICVTADKGRGAIFHFTLPVDPGSPS
jgi:PAS domain S-box-containing protein